MLNLNEYVVGADCGKLNTKVVVLNNKGEVFARDIFPTKISADISQNENAFIDAKTFKYKDKVVSIDSDNIDCETSTLDTKNDDIHKMCTIYGIAKNLPNNSRANVVIGCPLSVFGRGKTEKLIYRDNLIPKGRIDCDIIDHGDMTHKYFDIVHRNVFPEATGIIYLHPELMSHDIAVIDLGGLNVNAFILHEGSIVPSTCVSLKSGSKALYTKLLQKYNAAIESTGKVIEDIGMIPGFIKHGAVKNCENLTRDITRDITANYIKDILKELRKKTDWSKMDFCDKIVFVGGTSLLLANSIRETVPNAVVFSDDKEALFANAHGFARQYYDMLK